MQQRTINGSLPITARLLADDLGIKAHFGADGFACSQDSQGIKHLYIPNLPADDALASALALGGIVHEDGHFSETDLPLMQAISEKFVHALTNVLEDIRIEQHQIKKYAGAKSILAKMIRAMVDTGQFAINPEKDGLADLVFGYMVCELRTKVLQQEALGPNAVIAAKLLQEMLPGQAFAKLTDMMFSVRDSKSTLEVFNLAKQIIAMLQQELEQQDQTNPEPEPQESTDENQSDDSQGDEQPENAQGSNQPDAPPDDSEPDDSEGSGQPESAQGDSQSDDSHDDSQPEDMPGDGDPTDESTEQEQSGSNDSQADSDNQGEDQSNGQPEDQTNAEGQASDQAGPSEQEQSGNQGSQPAGGNPGADQDNGQSDDQSNAERQAANQTGGSSNQQNQGGSGGASIGTETDDSPDLGASNAAKAGETESADRGDVGGDTDDGTEPTPTGQSTGELADADAKAKALAGLLSGDEQSSKKWDTASVIAQALGERMVESEDWAVRLPDGIPMHLSAGNGEDVLARLRQETNAVRRKTLALLEAQARTKILNGRSGNRLDARRLWKTRTGDARVFEKRVEGHKQDTAIQLLVDRSISMHRRIVLASDAALAVAMAMEGAQGVSTSVAAFPYLGGGQSDDVLVISQFGESFRKTATRFPAIGVDGGTPMAEAMLWGGYNLHSENKERKILVVATDGQPDHQLAAESVIRQLEASGIEVMAIGIGVDVSGLFRTSDVIQDIHELPNVLFGMLQEKLAKAA